MFARYGDTRGMDHMRLHPMRTKPARQPEAVSTSFEGQCNPRDLAAGLDRLVEISPGPAADISLTRRRVGSSGSVVTTWPGQPSGSDVETIPHPARLLSRREAGLLGIILRAP